MINSFVYTLQNYFPQARAVSTDGLRPTFLTVNAVVYVIQVKHIAISRICQNWKFFIVFFFFFNETLRKRNILFESCLFFQNHLMVNFV